jgi:hypothetical protein
MSLVTVPLVVEPPPTASRPGQRAPHTREFDASEWRLGRVDE